MNVDNYYRQFKKGTQYFKEKWVSGLDTPSVRKQLADFEREVIAPMDAKFSKLDSTERAIIESEYVPF